MLAVFKIAATNLYDSGFLEQERIVSDGFGHSQGPMESSVSASDDRQQDDLAPVVNPRPQWSSPKLAYSVSHACEQLDLSASTLWKFIGLGKIRVVRLGGRTVIPHTELQRLMTEGMS